MPKSQIIPKWSWEVCKMFLYMTFPVAMFHYFNSPQLFEDSINKIKAENYPTVSSEKREYIKQAMKEVQEKYELRKLEELKAKQAVSTSS